jgi:zinc resistance-associated protein
MKRLKIIVTGIVVISILGLVGIAFAHGGYRGGHMGYGNHMGNGYHMGYGRHMGDRSHMGYDRYDRDSALTDEQYDTLEKMQDEFYAATNSLKDDIYQKRFELNRELDQQNQDTNKARSLQKELSGLEAQFDQKRLDYELELKKIAPESRRGFAGRNYGRGRGEMCW